MNSFIRGTHRLSRRLYSTAGIKERIYGDLIQAMRSKDTLSTGLLRQLHSELVKTEKSKPPGACSQADLIGSLRSCSERWSKAIGEYERLLETNPDGRAEEIVRAIEKERRELEVINGYLPEPYDTDELKTMIKKTIEEENVDLDSSKVGTVVKAMVGKIDMTRISRKDLAAAILGHLTKHKE